MAVAPPQRRKMQRLRDNSDAEIEYKLFYYSKLRKDKRNKSHITTQVAYYDSRGRFANRPLQA